MSEGRKNDNDKLRLELIHPIFLKAVAAIMTYGAKKYEAWNWYKGLKYGRIYGAIQRHLNEWWLGNNIDIETNESHLWHAACGIMFLIVFEAELRKDLDDRPKI